MSDILRLLVVDDNPNDRALVEHELRREFPDASLEQIADAEGWSRTLEAGQFDLVITDYELNWTDGLAVLRAVKTRKPDCPVIMYTGSGSEELAVDAIKAGLDDYVLKSPRRLVRLSAAVRSALEKAGQRQAAQEAEARYRDLFDRLPVGLYRSAPDGQILDANLAFVKLLGYPDRESLLAVNAIDLHVDPQERRQWQTLVENGESVQDFEMQLRRYDGQPIWVCDNAHTVRSADGRVRYYEGSLEVITLRKQAEEALARLLQANQRRASELQALYEASLHLSAQLEIDHLLRVMVEQAIQLLGAQLGGVYLYEARRGDLILSSSVGEFGQRAPATLKPGEGLAGRVFVNRHALTVEDYAAWPGRVEMPGTEGLGSVLGVPLLRGGQVLGVLDVASTARRFDEHDVWLADLFATQAVVALENARLHEEVRNRARERAALHRAGQAIASTLDLDQVLELVIAEVKNLVSAEGATVLLRDHDTNELYFAAAAGPGAAELLSLRLPATTGIAGAVASEGKSVLVEDAQNDRRFYSQVDMRTGLTTRSIVAVPLVMRGTIEGVVEAINKAGGAFTERDRETLEVMAGSAAMAIANARLFKSEHDQRELAETLREIGATLVSTLDVDTVLDRLLEQIGRVVPNDVANVMLIEDGHVRIARWRGQERFGIEQVGSVSYGVADIPNLRQMIETGKPVVIADSQADPVWLPHFDSNARWRSYAGAPIRVQGQVIGFLNAYSATPGFFRPSHAERLRVFANQAAIAWQNARLYGAEREQFRRLQRSQAQLIQAEKMAAMGRLVASIAHEINNPLQAVQGCLTLADEEVQGDLQAKRLTRYLGMASSEVGRIANIVHRVREFYRPASSEMQPADIHVILDSLFELIGKQLQESNVIVEREWMSDPPMIQGNPNYLKQVFLNLALNSIDAMSGHGGTLHVRTALDHLQSNRDSHPLPAVRVDFSDTGSGIPPEVMEHLFEPFVTAKKDGTGLGLSISYGIIEAHNGQISATSTSGKGTTFTILLPVAEEG